jgi:hypothetical protein
VAILALQTLANLSDNPLHILFALHGLFTLEVSHVFSMRFRVYSMIFMGVRDNVAYGLVKSLVGPRLVTISCFPLLE